MPDGTRSDQDGRMLCLQLPAPPLKRKNCEFGAASKSQAIHDTSEAILVILLNKVAPKKEAGRPMNPQTHILPPRVQVLNNHILSKILTYIATILKTST